jgi:hypothetical protein
MPVCKRIFRQPRKVFHPSMMISPSFRGYPHSFNGKARVRSHIASITFCIAKAALEASDSDTPPELVSFWSDILIDEGVLRPRELSMNAPGRNYTTMFVNIFAGSPTVL